MRRNRLVLFSAVAITLFYPAVSSAAAPKKAAAPTRAQAPTVAEAKAFVDEGEAKLLKLSVEASRAGWVQSTYITDDTEVLAAKANERAINAGVEYAKRATRYDKLKLPEDVARKMLLLKNGCLLRVSGTTPPSCCMVEIPRRRPGQPCCLCTPGSTMCAS